MSDIVWPWLLTGIDRAGGGHASELFIFPEALFEHELAAGGGARAGTARLEPVAPGSWRMRSVPRHHRRLLHLAARTTSERLARRIGGLRIPHLGVETAHLAPDEHGLSVTLTLSTGAIAYAIPRPGPDLDGQLARMLTRLYGNRLTTTISPADDPRQLDPVPAGAPRTASGERYWDGHVWTPVTTLWPAG